MRQPPTLGAEFARALAAKDFERVAGLLHPDIDFRGITPNRTWEADRPEQVIDGVLRRWFGAAEEIEALENLESDGFADRERVGYRFSVRRPQGGFVVEQQAYLADREGRIGWMRMLCSGFRPVD